MKKIDKDWIACNTCEHVSQCASGKSRIENISENSPILADIGCYKYEIYNTQISDTQLKLF